MRANKSQLYSDVEFLTALRPFRNYENIESLERVVTYLKAELLKSGFESTEQTWRAEGMEYKNIIASYNKSNPRRLIIGAHYDVCGDQPGADDNASAVAGLLETARMIASEKPELDYGIDFVFYCLEEPPFFATEEMGSYIHAKSLYDQKTEVIGMICYEMIGYFSDEPGSQSFTVPQMAERYPSVANFIIVVGIEKYGAFAQKVYGHMKKEAGIDVQIILFPTAEGLPGLSDHRNYWKFGYNAVMINDTSFVRNPHYHQPSDTIDTLDFDKMTEVINSVYRAIVNLG